MTTGLIETVVRNGRVEIDAPSEWREGTPVGVSLLRPLEAIGMREEDWPTTPEGIDALAKSWHEQEPLIMSEEEEAGLAAWR